MRASTIVLLSLLGGCQAQIHGTGTLYVFNGTEEKVELTLAGRTPAEVVLRRHTGKLLDELVAGPYQLSVLHGGEFGGIVATELVRDRLTIFNVGSKACFARADVAGMYTTSKATVRLLEIYKDELVFSIRDEIGVPPGYSLPPARKKSPFGFQRVAVVPCELTEDDWLVEDFMQKMR